MAASLLSSSILGVRGWGSLSAPLRVRLEALELTDPVGFRGLLDGSQGEAGRLALHFGGSPTCRGLGGSLGLGWRASSIFGSRPAVQRNTITCCAKCCKWQLALGQLAMMA